ncbi:hypothetical protein [Candidatus Accumulibacter sp. ACC003]|uniref:hypothetical protein n=1 Tax=Candidatus Accumulibacter sp. ACC003 TaxID=2823334 RepID=UPI0025B94C17|nr:hypothetical protein [Candidatus Accumulibacter sp. ACC003]
MSWKTLPLLIVLPLLVACSDQRAAFEIDSSQHSLTLIRVQNFFWERTATYAVVAARMPECMRRHDIGSASADTRFEVYSPGNDAWIFKQGKRMFVVETRTCQGFARLDEEPAEGMGALQGSFQMRSGNLIFVAAPKSATAADAVTPAAN